MNQFHFSEFDGNFSYEPYRHFPYIFKRMLAACKYTSKLHVWKLVQRRLALKSCDNVEHYHIELEQNCRISLCRKIGGVLSGGELSGVFYIHGNGENVVTCNV